MNTGSKGVECNVVQSCVSGTIPEYRGKGVWSSLVKFAISYFKDEGIYDFIIGFPNYKTSYNGFLKMNWSHDSNADNYLMIINGKNFVKSVVNRTIPLTKILGIQRARISLTNTAGFRTGEMVHTTQSYGSNGFSLQADDAFIEWKKKYNGLECFGVYTLDGKPVANCRYFSSTYRESQIIKLCDIRLVKETNSTKLFPIYSYCLKEIARKHKEAAFIRVWVMDGNPIENVYRRLLFFKVGNRKHANPFVTYCLKNDVRTCIHKRLSRV